MGLVLVGTVAAGHGVALSRVLLLATATMLPVAVLIVRQVRRGRWTNVDASNRHERGSLFVVAAVALGALLLWLRLTDGPSFLTRGAAGTLAMVLLAAGATRWIKLSLHLAFAALSTVTLTLLGSVVGLALVPVLPLLAWSRLALGRHHPSEVAAGTALGALTAAAIHFL